MRRKRPLWPALLLLAGSLAATAAQAVVVEQLLAIVNAKSVALIDLVRHHLLFDPELPSRPLLQRLIDERLILEEAARFEIEPIDPALVRKATAQLEQSFGSTARWQATLTLAVLTPEEVEQLVGDRIRIEAFLTQRVDLFVFASPTEVESIYDEQSERFKGLTKDEAEKVIEQELIAGKVVEKRREYVGRLRARATIRQLADPPEALPARPSP